MGEFKGRRIVELRGLRADCRHDGIAVVAGIRAPQTGGAVEDGAPLGRVVMHVLCPRDQPRGSLERAVRSKWQPERFEIIGNGGGSAGGC